MQVLEEDSLHNRPFHNNPVVIEHEFHEDLASVPFSIRKLKPKFTYQKNVWTTNQWLVYSSVKNIQHVKEIINIYFNIY